SATGYCEDLLCRPTPSGLDVLDEATGQVRWGAGPTSSLRRSGDVVVEVDALTQAPSRLLDASSGAVRAQVDQWQSVARGDGAVGVSRPSESGDSRVFAVGHHGVVSPVSRSDASSSQECRIVDRIMACRTDDGL